MTVEDFAAVLLAEMQADESTSFVDSIMKEARAALKKGGGNLSSLLNAGVNGKSFTKAVHLNAAQVLDACRRAINAYANDGHDVDEVSATYPDFSTLHR
ncbi:MAG: hypothetical protein IPK22_11190 [Verrucomicrobiaceae bacterium]|nr:hypothetical protein [Verrucomicrobiaceae bacterium]